MLLGIPVHAMHDGPRTDIDIPNTNGRSIHGDGHGGRSTGWTIHRSMNPLARPAITPQRFRNNSNHYSSSSIDQAAPKLLAWPRIQSRRGRTYRHCHMRKARDGRSGCACACTPDPAGRNRPWTIAWFTVYRCRLPKFNLRAFRLLRG